MFGKLALATATVLASGLSADTPRIFTLKLRGDGRADNLSAIERALASHDHVYVIPDDTGSIVGVSSQLTIPSGRTLEIHPEITIRALATGRNSSEYLTMLESHATLLCHGTLDGNLAARKRSGELDTFTWATVSEDVNNSYSSVAHVRDVGDAGNGNDGLASGGASLINMTASAKSNVHHNTHRIGVIHGSQHGFMARIRSPFRGVSEGELSRYCQYNTIQPPAGPGGIKNCVEVVGPHTRYNHVIGGIAIDPRGRGGFEADFGAYGNQFTGSSIVYRRPYARDFDGFSNRTSDIADGKLKVTRNNRFVRPRFSGCYPEPAFRLRILAVNIGSDVTFEEPYASVLSDSSGSSNEQSALLSIDARYKQIGKVDLLRPDARGVRNALRLTGRAGIRDIRIAGGEISYDESALSAPGASVDAVTLTRVRLDGPELLVDGSQIEHLSVNGCTFVAR